MLILFFPFGILVLIAGLLFLPLYSDAPLYHWPVATLAVIGANIIMNIVTMASPPLLELTALWLGDVINPLQWLTSIYVHAGPLHLFGNMIALWAFGSVVEGKIGTFWFLIIYHAIGVGESAIDQVAAFFFLDVETTFIMAGHTVMEVGSIPSYGASAAVFGLMGIAMIWAPVNQVVCPFSLLLNWEIPLMLYVFYYLATNFFSVWMSGLTLSSELFHLIGATLGLTAGVVLFKKGLVECEGYDLFAVLRGREGSRDHQPAPYKSKRQIQQEKEEAALRRHQLEQQRREQCARFREYLATGKIELALANFKARRKQDPTLQLAQDELSAIIAHYQRQREWGKQIPFIEEYLSRFSEGNEQLRLQLAKILLVSESRPRAALRALQPIDTSKLDQRGRSIYRSVVAKAQQKIDEGEIELGE